MAERRNADPEYDRAQYKRRRLDTVKVQRDREASRQHRAKNPEYMAEYRKRKSAEIREQRRGYRERNFERFRDRDNQHSQEWYRTHREVALAQAAERYRLSAAQIRARVSARKARRIKEDPEGVRAATRRYTRRRRLTDLKYALSGRMSNRIWYALKHRKSKKRGHWLDWVPYTLEELITRLTDTIPDGYNWIDFLEGRLHIDHKSPIVSFAFTQPGDPGFEACWALSNLQLLPAAENIRKGARLST